MLNQTTDAPNRVNLQAIDLHGLYRVNRAIANVEPPSSTLSPPEHSRAQSTKPPSAAVRRGCRRASGKVGTHSTLACRLFERSAQRARSEFKQQHLPPSTTRRLPGMFGVKKPNWSDKRALYFTCQSRPRRQNAGCGLDSPTWPISSRRRIPIGTALTIGGRSALLR